jgi:hypothetical protein
MSARRPWSRSSRGDHQRFRVVRGVRHAGTVRGWNARCFTRHGPVTVASGSRSPSPPIAELTCAAPPPVSSTPSPRAVALSVEDDRLASGTTVTARCACSPRSREARAEALPLTDGLPRGRGEATEANRNPRAAKRMWIVHPRCETEMLRPSASGRRRLTKCAASPPSASVVEDVRSAWRRAPPRDRVRPEAARSGPSCRRPHREAHRRGRCGQCSGTSSRRRVESRTARPSMPWLTVSGEGGQAPCGRIGGVTTDPSRGEPRRKRRGKPPLWLAGQNASPRAGRRFRSRPDAPSIAWVTTTFLAARAEAA